MFNQDEVNFIEETATRDMVALDQKIERLTDEMARNGKQLCDLKLIKSRLISILEAIKDNKEDDED